ncbi:MAG: MerR family transcriptional regulator [Dehalococcoidales bacterium]|nr:MerR family transcriptional regulator [Dehalococcoidales bacterium]
MPRPRVTSQMTTTQVARQLGMMVDRLVNWVQRGALPPPTWVDNNGVRYFDQEWLRKAQEIVESKRR